MSKNASTVDLRALRLARGLTQAGLAQLTGLSLTWIGTCERYPALMPSSTARVLAGVLGVNPEALLRATTLQAFGSNLPGASVGTRAAPASRTSLGQPGTNRRKGLSARRNDK